MVSETEGIIAESPGKVYWVNFEFKKNSFSDPEGELFVEKEEVLVDKGTGY